jgi:hypothetical protein
MWLPYWICAPALRINDLTPWLEHARNGWIWVVTVPLLSQEEAGATGLEPATYGFGDRRSTN